MCYRFVTIICAIAAQNNCGDFGKKESPAPINAQSFRCVSYHLFALYASLTALASWSAQEVGFRPQVLPRSLLSI